MYTAASGALVAQSAVDTIANNLANVDTTGFKRAVLQVQAQPKHDLYRFQTDPSKAGLPGVPVQVPIGAMGSGAQVYDTPADFAQGAIASTGNDLDVALSGPGFFAIGTANNTVRYTRDGQFVRDANNYLSTQNGDRVLDAGGNAIQLPASGSVQISRDGSISVNGQTYDRLGI